jgi:RNase adapter protein RapZ
MQFVIITGISGSGKSLALRIFEDMGFYCVDNMPPALIPQLASLCLGDEGQQLGVSSRGSEAAGIDAAAEDPTPLGPGLPPAMRIPTLSEGDSRPPLTAGLISSGGSVDAPPAAPSAPHPAPCPSSCGARVACVTDVRAGVHLAKLGPALRELEEQGVAPQFLFLDASDSVLVNRFKETRRKHPLLVPSGGILGSIAAEREMLKELKERADKVIDTSDYNPRALGRMLSELFGVDGSREGLTINVTSFGFKHGLPLDADLVFDVRFLANPHYVRELRWQDGRDEAVRSFVLLDPLTQPFLEKLFDLVGFTLPQYVAEGKAYLTIAIGCTGGRHRSVMVAEELAGFLRGKGYEPLVHHRDAKK